MIKILFLIHDLGRGGAEKGLVNLVNHMDPKRFAITVTALFGGGINEGFLAPHIRFRRVFPRQVPGNSILMKLLTPERLHRLCVKERFDVEVAYLEGPSARVISGCREPGRKLVCWIHSTPADLREAAAPFRSVGEARRCYGRFHRIVCVSESTGRAFTALFPELGRVKILYNTLDWEKIREQSRQELPPGVLSPDAVNLIAVGSLKPVKAFDRLIRIHHRLRQDGFPVHTYFLGTGGELARLRRLAAGLGCEDTVTFLGYRTNPYPFIARADLLVCCSLSEGLSTAAAEALILGTPVCTVEVSGMKEMLGDSNAWGVVTPNDEDSLYRGVRSLLEEPGRLAWYGGRAARRGRLFRPEDRVPPVERMLEETVRGRPEDEQDQRDPAGL